MATDEQVQANRQNALRSTGPRTTAGKRRSRANATKHGLCAEVVVVPGEDPAELTRFAERLRAEVQPKSLREEYLVERIALCTWRSRRYSAIEAALLRANVLRARRGRATAVPSRFVPQTRFADECTPAERQHERRVARFDSQLNAHALSAAAAFAEDAKGPDLLSKVTRYETSNERMLERYWRELERLLEVRFRREGHRPGNADAPRNDATQNK